jgi:hypothetical protein
VRKAEQRRQEEDPDDAAAKQRLYTLAHALSQYLRDHNNTFPPMSDAETLRKFLAPYVSDEEAYTDPETNCRTRSAQSGTR